MTSPTDTPKRSDAELAAELRQSISNARQYGGLDEIAPKAYLLDLIEDAAERLSTPPSQGKVSEEFLANIYVQSWDQHIGRDGAIAILNALDTAKIALTESSGQGTDVVTEQVIRQLDRAVAWIDEGKTYEISVLRGLLFHASSVLRRTSGTDGAEAVRSSIIAWHEEEATAYRTKANGAFQMVMSNTERGKDPAISEVYARDFAVATQCLRIHNESIKAIRAIPLPVSADGRAAVIEECAKVCDGVRNKYIGTTGLATECAHAIRALKAKQPSDTGAGK